MRVIEFKDAQKQLGDILDRVIEDADYAVGEMRELLEEQEGAIEDAGEQNMALFNETETFLEEADDALNESVYAVGNAHAELKQQKAELQNTALALSASVDGLEVLKATASGADCDVTIGAIDLTILGLESLEGNTNSQITASSTCVA